MPSKNLSVLLSQSKELYVCGVIQLHENDDPETYHWRKVEAPDVQFVSADAGFTDHIAAVDHDGSIWIGGSDYTEEYPQRNKIHFQKRYEEVFFLTVVCGSNFTLAIDSENRFWGGGSNTRGNLGHTDCRTYSFWYNPHSPPLRSVCAGKEHGYAVNTNCILEGFGGSDKCYRPVSDWASYCYDIQPLATPTKIIRVVAGNVHGLALDENDSVWGFGTSKWGQLGVVSTEPQEHIPPLLIKGLPEVAFTLNV
jgi:alpha-tubulin suppressor-like RCC1 family protein